MEFLFIKVELNFYVACYYCDPPPSSQVAAFAHFNSFPKKGLVTWTNVSALFLSTKEIPTNEIEPHAMVIKTPFFISICSSFSGKFCTILQSLY